MYPSSGRTFSRIDRIIHLTTPLSPLNSCSITLEGHRLVCANTVLSLRSLSTKPSNQRLILHQPHYASRSPLDRRQLSLSRWLRKGKGMRRRLGAWAESVGIVNPVGGGGGQREDGPENVGQEELFVMPGWAVIRRDTASTSSDGPYDIAFSISGFCSRSRPPSRVTRTQRVMLSVIQRFAALPSLPGSNPDNEPMGPLPTAVGMAFMEQGLEEEEAEKKKSTGAMEHRQYDTYQSRRQRARQTNSSSDSANSSEQSSIAGPSRRPRMASTMSTSSISTQNSAFVDDEAVSTGHANLQKRLAPFWSTALPNRRVLFDVYLVPDTPSNVESSSSSSHSTPTPPSDPIHSFELFTDNNGHFGHSAQLPWDKIQHAVDGSKTEKKKLKIRARLDYEPLLPEETNSSYRARVQRAISSYGRDANDALPQDQPRTQEEPPSLDSLSLNSPDEPQVIQWTDIRVGSGGGIHIISDLDDTIKHGDILAGPREVFRNVFCRPLEELCVPGMNEMYRRLDERGVAGFHIVSNSPSQLFPSINRFLHVNDFPSRHSIKLKYYGGRNIFASLYESPADRKRSSLRNLFDSLPTARFILIGDSAEQDLELYVECAIANPDRVAAIAIRDVTSDRATNLLREIEKLDRLTDEPSPISSSDVSLDSQGLPSGGQTRSTPQRSSSISSISSVDEEDIRSLTSAQQKILERANTWQERMTKARSAVSLRTEMIFFRSPDEVEGPLAALVDAEKSGSSVSS